MPHDFAVMAVADFIERDRETLRLFQRLNVIENIHNHMAYVEGLKRHLGTGLAVGFRSEGDDIFTKSSGI
jgi:hypothetical protein